MNLSLPFILSISLFAFSASITPGPNNLMLTSSGATFGFRRSVPHMAGIILGFPLLVALVGLGLGRIFAAFPPLQTVLKIAGIAYMIFLSWAIAVSGTTEGKEVKRPLSFLQAAAFQWVNPKAWFMGVNAIGAYTGPDRFEFQLALIVFIFFLTGICSTIVWTGFGTLVRSWLSTPRRLRFFNIGIAGLLLLSLVPFFFTL
ncbi:MAG TPA: LysE family translocator [Dongiaceae bacterium]|jgi:threonine/homoserine/homoserine lactone efflux protein|nr:LysE family translocator [Dongiaceae bacterium]